MTAKDHEMDAAECRGRLLELTFRLLQSFTVPALTPFLSAWPPSAGPLGPVVSSSLPVLQWLPRIACDAHAFGSALVDALCRAAPLLSWHQTYPVADLGAAFLQNYAWTEILGPRGRKTDAPVACGVLLLGPNTFYPHHRHEAEEIYVPLSGTADWQQGDAIWRQRAPGMLIYHRSEEPHAMRTVTDPLLALYLWRSADLSQRARLDGHGTA